MRSCCRGGYDPQGEDTHKPLLMCPVCSVWHVVRVRVAAGELIFSSFQSPNLVRHLRRLSQAADKLGRILSGEGQPGR